MESSHLRSPSAFSSADAYMPRADSRRASTAGRSTPPVVLQRQKWPAYCEESESEEDRHSDECNVREDVLNARIRAKVGSLRSSTDLDKLQHAGGQRDSFGSSMMKAPFLDGQGSDLTPYYDDLDPPVLTHHDSPTHLPRSGPVKMASLPSRGSLIDPSAFGFDARNGDPRVIMGEKGNDNGPPWTSARQAGRRESDEANIELITVPGLGTEYSEREVKEMRKEHKRARNARARGERLQAWFKGKDRLSGGCLTPRMAVSVGFAVLVALAVLLFFVIPRAPVFAVPTNNLLVAVPNGDSMKTHHSPTNFTMDMLVNLRADNTAGWVPTKANKMSMDVIDLSTLKEVGKGTLDGYTFPGRKKVLFQIPVHFAYASVNVTGDQTWSHWINACGPKYDHTPRQSLNLQLTIHMHIKGLLGVRGTSVQLSNLECPFTLQTDQT